MSLLKFTPHNHKYSSDDNKEWTSVTSFISNFKQPFDADTIAEKSSKNKKSKWYGLTPEQIKEAWKSEANSATTLGTWYHNCRESDICSFQTMERHGSTVPVFRPIEENGVKYSPNQKLTDGVYPEHMVYLRSAGICGQSDLVEVINKEVHITDYKTNKEIKTDDYTNWEGITDKMLDPVNHLDDCNLNHYSLQLSFYMYMIIKHNPRLKPGKMIIEHILFKEAGKDAYDNRVVLYDQFGEPVVDKIVQYEVPYLKTEVINIINKLRDNGAA